MRRMTEEGSLQLYALSLSLAFSAFLRYTGIKKAKEISFYAE